MIPDTTYYTPEQLDLLGRAADLINTNPNAHNEFLKSRIEAISTWTDAELIQKIGEYINCSLYSTTAGWWYGRVTDPRRKENKS